ncbi:unnamed protein product [Miscanthus lutarioriparius]|uniref:CCHC-type domain-containing protein n=1 Tax=Miscanthus lutarioriparius TaxID=422564 RepID=A0A811Q4L5_9POAL|nr:unnamed protein product [Miscanthus lutarioriparius]
MASINKTEFKVLELNGKNYQTWALDYEFHLQAMQLTPMIARPAAVITELEMIEKTLKTFHTTNMAQNGLLMKNFHMCPDGTQAHPEAHASFRNNNGKGSFRNNGQKFHGQHGQKGGKFKNRGQKSNGNGKGQKFSGNGKGKSLKGSKDEASGGKHSNEGCFRCGSHQHWSRTCTIDPHLIELYQEWKKRQNPKVHFVQASVDAMTGLDLP